MITVEVSHSDLEYVQKKLKGASDKAPMVIRNSANDTAVKARKMLAQHAQERYTVKSGGFNNHAKLHRATLSHLTAEIRVNGTPLSQPRYHTTTPRGGAKTEVLKGSGLKALVNSAGNKAFKTKVATGNANVQAGKRRKKAGAKATDLASSQKTADMILQRVGKSRYPLRSFHGPSVPKMIEKVYQGGKITDAGLKEKIEQIYQENLQKQIDRVMNG